MLLSVVYCALCASSCIIPWCSRLTRPSPRFPPNLPLSSVLLFCLGLHFCPSLARLFFYLTAGLRRRLRRSRRCYSRCCGWPPSSFSFSFLSVCVCVPYWEAVVGLAPYFVLSTVGCTLLLFISLCLRVCVCLCVCCEHFDGRRPTLLGGETQRETKYRRQKAH